MPQDYLTQADVQNYGPEQSISPSVRQCMRWHHNCSSLANKVPN
jgi:hypothetical protein